MARKEHLTKLEEDQTEVGIQLRDSAPPTGLENRIFINKNSGEMRGHFNGADVALSFDLYNHDPITPIEKQVWINTQTNELKWHFSGVTQGVSLAGGLKTQIMGSSSEYVSTLTEEELGELVDVTTFLPNYLLDAFNKVNGEAVLINTKITASTLQVQDGQTSGTYELQRRTSPAYNHVEGVAVIKSQAIRPKDIVDNLDGTHTLTFEGSVTDTLKAGAKCLAYEEEVDAKDIKSNLHLLDGNLNPALLSVLNVTYDNVSDQTVVAIQDNGLDLTFGRPSNEWLDIIRFKPINIKVEAGGDTLLGAMTELDVVEVEDFLGLSKVLGEENLQKVSAELINEKIIQHRIQHSPDKNYWILQLLVVAPESTGRLAGQVRQWTSSDGLKTINYQRDWFSDTSRLNADEVHTPTNHAGGSAHYLWFTENHILINNDGRYVLSHGYYSPSAFWAPKVFFGDLTKSDSEPKTFTGGFGNYTGTIGFETASYHYYSQAMTIDWDENLFFIETTRNNEDQYVYQYELDWGNNQTFARGYYYLGVDFHTIGISGHMFVKEFEDQKQLFTIFEHGNNLNYAYKYRYKKLLGDLDSGFQTNFGYRGHTGSINYVSDDGYNIHLGAFSNSLVGGIPNNTGSFFHRRAFLRLIGYDWDLENDRLVSLWNDTDNEETYITAIDFGRTTYGKPNSTDLLFDQVPTNGNFTLDVYDHLTLTTETTSPIPFSATNAQVQSIIEGISFIGAGEVTVEGDYTTGYQIRLSVFRRKPINFLMNTNALSASGTPVVVTINEIEQGFEPVWLRFTNDVENDQLFDPANGLRLRLDSSRYASNNIAGGAIHVSSNYAGERAIFQSMRVRGQTIIAHYLSTETSNGHDMYKPMIMKIPDYTQCYGVGTSSQTRHSTPGVEANQHLVHKSQFTTQSAYGTRFSQKFNSEAVPFGGGLYLDGKIPIRSMSLYCYPNWRNQEESKMYRPAKDEFKVRLRIMPVGNNGFPDWDNPIAISRPRTVNHLTNAGDTKWENFCFDNVKLEPATDYFWGVDMTGGGWDLESDFAENGEDRHEFVIKGRSVTTTNTCFAYQYPNGADQAGEWVSVTRELWFKWKDFYDVPTFDHHVSGVLPNITFQLANWHDGSNFQDVTIHPIENGLAEEYLATYSYRGTGQRHGNTTDYSPYNGGTHPYVFKINDTAGKELFPVIEDAQILGWDDSPAWDRHLVMAVACGVNHPSQIRSNGLTDSTPYQYSNQVNEVGEGDYDYLASTQWGGNYISHDASIERRKEFSGATNGIEDDPDFYYGKCTHFNGVGGFYVYNHTVDMTPWQQDFIWELEYKPSAEDVDGRHVMIVGSNQAIYWGFYTGRLHFYAYYNGTGRHSTSLETFEAERYVRIRITRDYDNGLKMFRNYSKTGGTWEELGESLQFGGVPFSFWKHGACIGDSDITRTYYSFGRWTENTSYNCYGRIGYVKFSRGTSEFAYEGLNFDQKSMAHFQNTGDQVTALRNTHSGYTYYYNHGDHDFVIAKHDKKSAKVKSDFTVLKYKKTIASGRNISTKITLERASDQDPSALEGYLLNYVKK